MRPTINYDNNTLTNFYPKDRVMILINEEEFKYIQEIGNDIQFRYANQKKKGRWKKDDMQQDKIIW